MSYNQNMKRVIICYDFDKTLTPLDMQSQGFVQDVGFSVDDFWKEVDDFSVDEHAELNLTYMFKMLQKAKAKGIKLTKQYLNSLGKNIRFFDGLDTWFDRINAYGEQNGVEVHHFVLSSGTREIVEGTSIAKHFDHIYASAFLYGADGEAVWPAFVVNYTNKTQSLFRISKGIFDELDEKVNAHVDFDKFFAPFENFAYVGDSDTDIPCMALITGYGGLSIGVFDKENGNMKKVERLEKEGRIQCAAEADYRDGSELDTRIKAFIIKVSKAAEPTSQQWKSHRYDGQYELN